jgi:hypothetical protein
MYDRVIWPENLSTAVDGLGFARVSLLSDITPWYSPSLPLDSRRSPDHAKANNSDSRHRYGAARRFEPLRLEGQECGAPDCSLRKNA